MQQNSWAQGRPTHGRETSPNRTHNKTQGNYEVRALQQPPNAAHAERAISKPPPSLYKVPTYSTRAGAAPRAPGGARHGGGNRAVNSQPGTEQSTLYGDVKSSYGGAGGWDRRGCATWAPRSATRQGEEQHRHTERGSHTRRDKGGHSRQGGGAQQGGRGNWNSGNREPEWSGWQSVRMGGSDNKGDGLASQPRRYRVPGQPLLNRHQVGGVSRSPDGLSAQQEWEPIRGRPTVRGKRTYGGRPGQRVEEQGTWAAQKHSEAGNGRPVDRGVWTAKTVKRPRQQPAHPQYANYWAPLTRKRHTMPHSAQSQHTNHWAPRTRKRHQQEHRPQRPTESSDLTQHAKGRTGDRPGPRKGATTRRNVTQGAGFCGGNFPWGKFCVSTWCGIFPSFFEWRCGIFPMRNCACVSVCTETDRRPGGTACGRTAARPRARRPPQLEACLHVTQPEWEVPTGTPTSPAMPPPLPPKNADSFLPATQTGASTRKYQPARLPGQGRGGGVRPN